MIEIGFTGTRRGMLIPQKRSFIEIVQGLLMEKFHHGDCSGSDAEAHDLIAELRPEVYIEVHPPLISRNRAYKVGDFVHSPKDYFKRNCNIVSASTQMIATPKGMSEDQRSGTWHAIRYAKSIGKPITIIWPNGSIIEYLV